MVGGPGVAGKIFDVTQSYVTAFYVGGGLFLVGSFVMFLIPLAAKFEKKKLVSQAHHENNNHEQEEQRKNPIVKRDALLKQAQKNSASKNGSKWNGDVQKHLDALDAIENEINSDDLYLIGKTEQNGNGNVHGH